MRAVVLTRSLTRSTFARRCSLIVRHNLAREAWGASGRNLSSRALRANQERLRLRLGHVHTEQTRSVENDSPEVREKTKQIVSFGRQGAWQNAKLLFDSVQDKTTILYNATMTAADRCGRYSEGLKLFEEMRALQVVTTGVSYGAALTLLGREGKYSDARNLWNDMRKSSVEPTSACLTGLLNAAAAHGDVESVEAEMAAAVEAGWKLDAVKYGCLMRACRERGDPACALGTLKEMRNKNVDRTVVIYTQAMGTVARAAAASASRLDNLANIETILREMSVDRIEPDSYFVEEHVRAFLGMDLKHMMSTGLSGNLTTDVNETVLKVLRDFAENGNPKSRLLTAVEQFLLRHSEHGVDAPLDASALGRKTMLLAGWEQTVDPASGHTYYWQTSDPVGTVTWQRPNERNM